MPATVPPLLAPITGALAEAMAAIDPDRLTPREALDALYRLRSIFVASHDDAVATAGDTLD